eukprot:10599875-Heterocapsa_arctica.AAC.1
MAWRKQEVMITSTSKEVIITSTDEIAEKKDDYKEFYEQFGKLKSKTKEGLDTKDKDEKKKPEELEHKE